MIYIFQDELLSCVENESESFLIEALFLNNVYCFQETQKQQVDRPSHSGKLYRPGTIVSRIFKDISLNEVIKMNYKPHNTFNNQILNWCFYFIFELIFLVFNFLTKIIST